MADEQADIPKPWAEAAERLAVSIIRGDPRPNDPHTKALWCSLEEGYVNTPLEAAVRELPEAFWWRFSGLLVGAAAEAEGRSEAAGLYDSFVVQASHDCCAKCGARRAAARLVEVFTVLRRIKSVSDSIPQRPGGGNPTRRRRPAALGSERQSKPKRR